MNKFRDSVPSGSEGALFGSPAEFRDRDWKAQLISHSLQQSSKDDNERNEGDEGRRHVRRREGNEGTKVFWVLSRSASRGGATCSGSVAWG